MVQQQYHLDPDGSFVIDDYDHAKAFSNFFPGIAGLYGIPMWAFYVNRGQGITSFGVESKDKAILEFQPANRAYRLTSIQGFRTFIKVGRSPRYGPKQNFYEPFAHSSFKVRRRMILTSHDLTIEEVNASLGLKVTVNYFTMPEENYAALVRRVTIANTSDKPLSLSMIDGLPALNPYGLKDSVSKNMSRTAEAWGTVRNLGRQVPFYQLKVQVADTPQVTHIHEGNFYFAFQDHVGARHAVPLLDVIVEAAAVFGHATDFLVPEKFLSDAHFRVPACQQTSNRTPCAMAHAAFVLKAGGSREITSLTGFAHDLKEANAIARRAADPRYVAAKALRNRQIIDGIKDLCFTHSAKPAFDRYAGQTFLDNVLRGGLPVSLQTAEGPVSFNVYSRKHGDLERDYNFFVLAPTHLSQGNGNYRDVNQNRRNDVWFNADVKESTVVYFLNLVQADGYNPLTVKGTAFAVGSPEQADALIKEFGIKDGAGTLKGLLIKGFMPGDLLELVGRSPKFLARVLSVCRKQEQADCGEGFWTDHWTYNLDLIESFWGVYPENLRRLLLEEKFFHFFLNDTYVLPREKRYILTDRGVRQYRSLAEQDKEVGAKDKGHRLRTKNGRGDVYHTTLAVKLLCLLANKAATFDPSGIGIEMEANKPNWYDALNGLPGLLGSSISETFEVKRLGFFLNAAMERAGLKDDEVVFVFVELADFVEGLDHLLSLEQDPLKYWHKANDLKENYRRSVRLGITGAEKPVKAGDVRRFCKRITARADAGIAAAQNGPGLPRRQAGLFAAYFTHEITRYDVLEKSHEDGSHHVRPLAFKRHDLPLFLEGFVHALRVESDPAAALELYRAVKKSKLYDRVLGMYKVTADLSGESEEIGRAQIFPAGWLENGSIWLHMEYKYLLEVLRRGLYAEFFEDALKAFVPFMDPACYGRSILENSSFIVSSVHEDKDLHGQGFVARLSGSTAEFVHMWLVMSAGHKPFTLDTKGELTLEFKPVLPGWMFTAKAGDGFDAHTYAFKFLGTTLIVYHNAGRVDTFGPRAVKPVRAMVKYALRREPVIVQGGVFTGVLARDIRGGKVERVDITLM